MAKEFYTRYPFRYAQRNLDRGEVITLAGKRNDSRLVALGYFVDVPVAIKTHKCDTCGRKFIDESFYTQHKKKPNCFSPQKSMTRAETAQLLGVDEQKVEPDPSGEVVYNVNA